MAIDIFTVEEFEEALPVHKETGEPVWVGLGLLDGEYVYTIPVVDNELYILVRSSIQEDGLSAGVGEDSIRAWLVNKDWQPVGSKISFWTTREPGWQERMVDTLRKLWNRARDAGFCPVCGRVRGVFRVRKNNKNKGKLFYNCIARCDGSFGWVE